MEYCRNRFTEREKLLCHYAGNGEKMDTGNTNNTKNIPEIDISLIQNKFFQLEKLLKEEIIHHLDYSLLELYLNEDLIPRGLRLRCEPSFKDDELFVQDWFKYIHECSKGLLVKLKAKRDALMKIRSEEIQTVSSELSKYRHIKGFMPLDRLLTSRITHFERELFEKKSNKLNRDRKDYAMNNVQYWLNNDNNNGIHNTRTTDQRDNTHMPIDKQSRSSYTHQSNRNGRFSHSKPTHPKRRSPAYKEHMITSRFTLPNGTSKHHIRFPNSPDRISVASHPQSPSSNTTAHTPTIPIPSTQHILPAPSIQPIVSTSSIHFISAKSTPPIRTKSVLPVHYTVQDSPGSITHTSVPLSPIITIIKTPLIPEGDAIAPETTDPIITLEQMGAQQSTSLNLPPTIFVQHKEGHKHKHNVQFHDPPVTQVTNITNSDPYNTIETADCSSSSEDFNDSLYTICNTPNTYSRPDHLHHPTLIDLEDYSDVSRLGTTANSNTAVSFLELPPLLTPSPLYHIRQTPTLMKITEYFPPQSLKRKLGEEQEEVENLDSGEADIEPKLPHMKIQRINQTNQ